MASALVRRFFFLMIRRPPRSTPLYSSAASDVYKRQAQNLTPHEVKTIITRVGEATKVVLTGDPYQIDNPYVDATSNGLTTVVEKFKGETIAGHVTLSKGERSQLAELAS